MSDKIIAPDVLSEVHELVQLITGADAKTMQARLTLLSEAVAAAERGRAELQALQAQLQKGRDEHQQAQQILSARQLQDLAAAKAEHEQELRTLTQRQEQEQAAKSRRISNE